MSNVGLAYVLRVETTLFQNIVTSLTLNVNCFTFDMKIFNQFLHYDIHIEYLVLQTLGFELGSFGLRDQCSTDWAKGDIRQPSQYQATSSDKHLWHIPPQRGISSSRLEVQSHFCKFDKEYFCHKKNTKSTLERHCHRSYYSCEKLYCTRWDSISGPLVYETNALPIELKAIPSSRVSIKRLIRTNTCDKWIPHLPKGTIRYFQWCWIINVLQTK